MYGTGSYQRLVELAEKKLEIVMERDGEYKREAGLYCLLVGIDLAFAVKLNKGAPHNCHAVVDGIYSYYNKHPEKKIDETLDSSLRIYMVRYNCTRVNSINEAFNIFAYIHYKQQKNEAPFTLNVKEYMQLLRENALEWKQKHSEFFPNIDLEKDLEEKCNYFEN